MLAVDEAMGSGDKRTQKLKELFQHVGPRVWDLLFSRSFTKGSLYHMKSPNRKITDNFLNKVRHGHWTFHVFNFSSHAGMDRLVIGEK